MDFGKFRLGGELSDIEVDVDGKQLQLHRFPLYTRSNFFLKEFAKLGSQHVITLENFPGGPEIFTVIADYCYNISVNITVDNVMGLRCGAKYLEMYGSGNLYEKTGLLIEEIVRNGRKGRDLPLLVKLISNVANYQSNETTQNALDHCTASLVYHWNKSQFSTTVVDEIRRPDILSIFFQMEFSFFISLLKMLKEKSGCAEVLDVLVSEYILHVLENNISDENENTNDEETPTKDTGEVNGEVNGEVHGEVNGEVDTEQVSTGHAPMFSEEKLEKVQRLLNEIQPNISRNTASKWLKPLLEAYSQAEGSDAMLGSIAASMANQIDADSISKMSEQTLISFAEKVNSDCLSDKTKALVTDNLVARVDNSQLSASGFMMILRKLKLHQATCHDNLLYIISTLNTKPDGFDETDLTECLAMVDMRKCSIKALRHAQQSDGIPSPLVLNAALDLCEILQEKTDVSAEIIQEQEKEISTLTLNNYGMLRIDTSPPRTQKVRASSHTSLYTSPTKGDTRNGSSSTSGFIRASDGIWSADQSMSLPSSSHHDTNGKLSEFLRKQRQSKLWKS